MDTYLIKWEIHIDAVSPLEAVKLAREIQLDRDSIATYFRYEETGSVGVIDLENEK